MLDIIRHKRIRRGMAVLVVLLICSCQTSFTSDGSKTSIYTDSASEPYERVFKEYTRAVSIHKGFDLVTDLHATLLSKDFLSNFEKKYFERLPAASDSPLKEAKEKIGLFVSLYTPIKDNDMTDPKFWSYTLKHAGQDYKIARVKKIKQKQEWTPFFPYINIWTVEYLLLFELAPTQISDAQHGSSNIDITLYNLQSKTELNF
ncbi:MAG: hypothetical protein KA436_10065 [Oligoflexales bacterium]|nr:hypothetical protein [Oligoflexales bacterium]